MAGTELRRAILQLAEAKENAVIGFGSSVLTIQEGGEQRNFCLRELTLDDHGYVTTAEKTFDPPTSKLDENGQGRPYAVYGYGAHMAEIEIDIELGHGPCLASCRRARCRPSH